MGSGAAGEGSDVGTHEAIRKKSDASQWISMHSSRMRMMMRPKLAAPSKRVRNLKRRPSRSSFGTWFQRWVQLSVKGYMQGQQRGESVWRCSGAP